MTNNKSGYKNSNLKNYLQSKTNKSLKGLLPNLKLPATKIHTNKDK